MTPQDLEEVNIVTAIQNLTEKINQLINFLTNQHKEQQARNRERCW